MPRLRKGRASLVPSDSSVLSTNEIRLERLANSYTRRSSFLTGPQRSLIGDCGLEWFLDGSHIWKPMELCRLWRLCPICMHQKARMRGKQYCDSVYAWLIAKRRKRISFACFKIDYLPPTCPETLPAQLSLQKDIWKFIWRWRRRRNGDDRVKVPAERELGPLAIGTHLQRSPRGHWGLHNHIVIAMHRRASPVDLLDEFTMAFDRRFMDLRWSDSLAVPGMITHDFDRDRAQQTRRIDAGLFDLLRPMATNDVWKKTSYNFGFYNFKLPQDPNLTDQDLREYAKQYSDDVLELYPYTDAIKNRYSVVYGSTTPMAALPRQVPVISPMHRRVLVGLDGSLIPRPVL